MSEQRQGGSSLGQTSNGHTREGTAKVRSSSANGLTQGNPTQPRNNCRSGCVSSDQIDSGAASSRDGSEIYDGELKSRDIIEELEKLHVSLIFFFETFYFKILFKNNLIRNNQFQCTN